MKDEIKVTAGAVALAIKETRKFRKEEQEKALKLIDATFDADMLEEVKANPANLAAIMASYNSAKNTAKTRIGNVSQVRQELERAGLVDGNNAQTAFMVACSAAAAELVERETATLGVKPKAK